MTAFSTRDMCLIGMFVAIIAIMAQVSIPLPGGVPLTLQTFAIALAGFVLGSKNGLIAAIIYIMLGAVGAPVFSHFGGGLPHIIGPTGGFIMSFPVIAYFAGIAANKKSTPLQVLWLSCGIAINHLCGMLYFSFVTSLPLTTAFTAAVLPFLPIDLVRMALVLSLGNSLRRYIPTLSSVPKT